METPIVDKNNPFCAKMSNRYCLNKPGSGKNTWHFVMDITGSGICYEPGDSLGVYPQNNPETVDHILRILGFRGDEAVLIPKAETAMPIREALLTAFSLSQPTKKLLEWVLTQVQQPQDREGIQAVLSFDPEQLKVYLAEREILDILEEAKSVRTTPQSFIEQLRKLMPRLYSIASSPTVYPNEAHFTIEVIEYVSNGRVRHGVASGFLAYEVKLNQTPVPVFLAPSHFRLPKDNNADVIMVGPGTGVAPYRAFLQERKAQRAKGRNWLFFGSQHEATDYLYKDELEAFLQEGVLSKMDLAFSRDQASKVYVQDRMLEHAQALWEWIDNGAYFYVCGDMKRMAKDVDAMLQRIIHEKGNMDLDAAKEYVKKLKKMSRYQRDVY